jgi:hypothetical protein
MSQGGVDLPGGLDDGEFTLSRSKDFGQSAGSRVVPCVCGNSRKPV